MSEAIHDGVAGSLHQAGANWNKAISESIIELHQKGKLTPRSIEKAIKRLKGSGQFRDFFANSVKSPISHSAWKRVENKGQYFDTLLRAHSTANSLSFWQRRALLQQLGEWARVGVKAVGWVGLVYALDRVGTAYAQDVPAAQIASSLARDETLIGLAHQAAETGVDKGWAWMEGWATTCPVGEIGSTQKQLLGGWEDEHSEQAPDCGQLDAQLEALGRTSGAQCLDSTVLGK